MHGPKTPYNKTPFELSISDYFEMQKELDDIKGDTAPDVLLKNAILAEYLLGVNRNSVLNMDRSDAIRLFSLLNVSTAEATRFPKPSGYKVFTKMSDLSIAQYIDFQMCVHEVETHPEKLLSVLIVPDGHEYNDGYDTAAHMNWLRDNIQIGESNKLITFFLKRYLTSTHRTLRFLRLLKKMSWVPKKMRKEKKAEIELYDALITQTRFILGTA